MTIIKNKKNQQLLATKLDPLGTVVVDSEQARIKKILRRDHHRKKSLFTNDVGHAYTV